MDKLDRIIKSLLYVLLCLVGCFAIVIGVHIIGQVFPIGLLFIFGAEMGYLFMSFYNHFKEEDDE